MSAEMHNAYVAFGSNLGQREKNISAALNAMETTREIDVVKVSSLYETSPEGGPADQPAFINGVVSIRTSLGCQRLLAVCQHIEESLGRKRTIRWGPRTIDLDILSFDREIRGEPALTLPHPMMHERDFVMRPLAEIAPDWVHPVLEQSAATILDKLSAEA